MKVNGVTYMHGSALWGQAPGKYTYKGGATAMAFERMKIAESDVVATTGKAEIRFTRYGTLAISSKAVLEHDLAQFHFCELFYEPQTDRTRARIQMMLFPEAGKGEMRFPIKHNKRKGSEAVTMVVKVRDTFRARGILPPAKPVSLPYAIEDRDVIVIGLPVDMAPRK